MNKIDLTGKRVLVTGGSQGIGAEICTEMARCGARVLINYNKSQAEAERVAQSINSNGQHNAAIFKADVSDKGQVTEMFSYMDSVYGGIDVLVNNAGYETITHILDMSEEEWNGVLDVNLKGPFLCAQQAAVRMERQNGGVIINISSIHDQVPRKGLSHYCTSKAGLRMLTKCLSLELASANIRVVSLAPGAIETNINRHEIEKFGRDKFERWIPQGRLGRVQDVAQSVTFLASDLAEYINGTDLYIDGSYMNHTIQYDPRPARKQNSGKNEIPKPVRKNKY